MEDLKYFDQWIRMTMAILDNNIEVNRDDDGNNALSNVSDYINVIK